MDSFAQVLTSWRRIHDLDAAPAYLQRAVLNRCHSVLRRRGPEHRANARVARETPAHVNPDEPADHIAVAVRALPARQREAVVLTYWLGLSEAETAVAMGCRPGTVKSTLSHARTRLAEALKEDSHG
jgi:RNA polymerase sigma factor (sigma-70 family)